MLSDKTYKSRAQNQDKLFDYRNIVMAKAKKNNKLVLFHLKS